MTDHCCQSHEHQVAFVANISLDELAQKRKQTLSKLNNSSSQLCSLWFFRTSLKRLHEKTPKNRNKNACRLSSLSLLAGSSTPSSWNSPLLQLEDTPLRASSRHVTDLAYDGPPTNECLNFSPANPTYDFASKITQSQQQPTSVSRELPGLGISLDDSRISWTSSLATPPGYTATDALPDEDETEFLEQATKTKTLARALFSPDGEQSTLDGVGQLSSNISVAFKSCDKTPTTNRMVSSPNTLFSPVLFESKDTSTVLSEHESVIHHNNPFSISPLTSLPHGDPHATIGDNKLPGEISCRSFDTPVSRMCSDVQLHSILSKKKHFSSTPKHVHFSDSCLPVSDCDKRRNKFNSADKLRQLRDSIASPSDLTLVSQSDKDTSFVETQLLVISKKQPGENLEEECTPLAALGRLDTVAHELQISPDSKTTHRHPPCSEDEPSINASFTQSSNINSKLVDSSGHLLSVAPDICLSSNSRSHNSSWYESTAPSANENQNGNLTSLSSERQSLVDSSSNNQSCQNNLNSTVSPELISSADISENFQSLSKTNEFPKVSLQQANPEDLTVSSGNKDDKNTIIFTQLSSSYDEKLISEVDRMSSRDLQEMSTSKPSQIEQCAPIGDKISEKKEVDLNCSLSIIDNGAQLSTLNQKDTPGHCTTVTPIDHSPDKKPVPSKETVSLSKTTPNNLDTPTSSSLSTPKFAISLGGKFRRKSKGFLYPTASQINNTSPLVAFNFKVQSIDDNKPNYIMKGTVDPSASANSDTPSSTGQRNRETDMKKSLEQDLGSGARTLICENTESSSKISDLHSTTIKQHEMAMMDPLHNNRKPQSSSQPKIVNGSLISNTLELPDKIAEGSEVVSSSCQDQLETEKMFLCNDSVHEPVQTNKTFQSFPILDTDSNPNNQISINVSKVSECLDTGIHRKAKFYRSQHKPKVLETEVPKVKYCKLSRSEPNPKSPKQHSTVSVIDHKSSDKQMSLIPDSSLNQNSREVGNITRESTTVQNDQEMLEMNMLTPSQMVRWEELDNFSEAFIENDDNPSSNTLHGQNNQACSTVPEAEQVDCKVKPKKYSSDLAKQEKNRETEIQIYQNTNVTTKTKETMQSVCYESYKLSSENEESIKVQSLGSFSTAGGKQITVKEESLQKAQSLLYDESTEARFLEDFSTAKGKLITVREENLKKAQNLVNDELSEAQSLGGFSTAGGKQITVKEESLKKAQNLVNDELSEAQSLGGFSTAKGKQITVKEESLKKAQNLVNDELGEAQSLGGFSTAKGKQITVKEESLKKAQNLVNDELGEAQSLGGFSTAKGKQITVKEESLKKAQNLVNDELGEAQSLGGFSTAKGKQITVKEESLKKAQNLVNDELGEAQSLGGFSTAKGKQITVKEESLKKAQNLVNDELGEAQSLGGFSTAKGKQITVKEESLKKAQSLVNDESVEVQSLRSFSTSREKAQQQAAPFSNQSHESSLTGNDYENIEYLAKHSDNKDSCQSPVIVHFNSPADECNVDKIPCKKESKINEVKHLSGNGNKNDQLEGLILDCKVEPLMKKINEKNPDQTNSFHPNNSIGFNSPSMNKEKSIQSENKPCANLRLNENLTVQNKSTTPNLKSYKHLPKGFRPFKAPRMLSKNSTDPKSSPLQKYSENEKPQCMDANHTVKCFDKHFERENEELQEIHNSKNFSAARGKQNNVIEKTLEKVQNLLHEESIEDQSLGGFSTAKGKQISVKEESLKKAQELVNNESLEAQSLVAYSTVKGKQISEKKESLKGVQNPLHKESIKDQSLGGFSTARGQQISIKEESLKKAQNFLNEELGLAHSLEGFTRAKGKQINVDGESLKKAQKFFHDESKDVQPQGGFSTARGKQIGVKEESLKKAQKLLNEGSVDTQSLGGFSTARGKQISVKEESLKKAQNLLNEESVQAKSLGGFLAAKGKRIDEEEESLKNVQNFLNDEQVSAHSLGDISSARGKQSNSKEESLEKAQNLFNVESTKIQSLGGFSTARGKQIAVKEESLKKAQNLMNDESVEVQSLGGFSTAKGKQITVKEESLKKAQNLVNDESVEVQSLGGFSTARGKQITVKEESLKKAQNLMNDESVEVQSLGGFSTARGKQISLKEESLKKAQNLFIDESTEAQSMVGSLTDRGNQISVKEKRLKITENFSIDESIEPQCLRGFSTAKGQQIIVAEDSLKKAEILISEATFEPPPKFVKSLDAFQDENVLVENVDAMDENVVNDLLLTDFTASQMNGVASSSTKVSACTLVKVSEVTNNYNHMIEDIFNSSWEDDSSTSSKKMPAPADHPPNKLKRSVSEVISVESGSTVKKARIDIAENDSSPSVCQESSKNNLNGDKPCLLALPTTNAELGRFSKSQYISDDALMQSVKIYENLPDADPHFQIVSEDQKTESEGCDAKDQYLNDSDCSNESEMALAVEKLEGERKCSEISRRSTKQPLLGTNQMTGHKISSSSGDKANYPSDHSHQKFTPESKKTCEADSTLESNLGETIECSQQKNATKADMDKIDENYFHDQFKGNSKDNSCQNRNFELTSRKFPTVSSEETSINKERDIGTSKITSGFQTCLGQKVHVSQQSLQKAVEMLNSTSENRSEDVQLKMLADHGKSVHVSEKALQEAVKALDKQTLCEEGKNIAHQNLDAENSDEMNLACSKTKCLQNLTSKETKSKTFIPFQTAHGKDVPISEKSVNKARQILDAENLDEMDPSGSKAKYPQNPTPKETKSKTFIPFQTAHGKDVPISEKSVNKARQILGAETPEEIDSSCSKAKYPRKVIPSFGPALQHKPEDALHVDPQIDNEANSISSTFKSLQHETHKINVLGQKQSSISWKPCMSTPEADRSGISPIFTGPDQILSDQSSHSQQHLFSDLISQNPLDIKQSRFKEKTLEKTGQDDSSKKTDFKTPYRKTPSVSKAQETVKVFSRISRPVFKGYGTLPISPQKKRQKYLNSNLMSSTICENSSNVRGHIDKLNNEEPCKENQIFQNLSCSNESSSTYTAGSNLDNNTQKSHFQESYNKNQNTNLLSINSSTVKSSDCKQFEEEEITKKNVRFLEETKSGLMSDQTDADGSSSKHPIQEIKKISKKKVSSLEKNKLGLVPDEPNADALSRKDPIPAIKENLPDQYQKTNQEEMQAVSRNVPHLVSSEDSSCDGKKLSRNLESIDKNLVCENQLESKPTETFCSEESHLEEGRLEQDMIILRNKRKKISPLTGIFSRRKESRKRIKLSDLHESINVSSFLPEQFFNYGIHQSTLAITSANAIDYRFKLSTFYNAKCLHRIIIGDGAILVADRKFTAGKEEFFRAFQTIEGVDSKLISPEWLFNHYRWIIWKLAAYEVALPQYFGGRCLSPEMVALQLKFRYDFEIDKCQRSALRRIIERDDTPAKRMVLCVSQINQDSKTSDAAQATAQSLATLEVTDGWYSTKLFIDSHLSFLVSKGKLRIGQKLCISNAELVGSDTACSPLEAMILSDVVCCMPNCISCSESIGLKVSGNGCRPARWDTKLGYQTDPQPLCLPLVQIAADGGLVGCIDVIVTRIYPIRYMEKLPGGGSVFRTSRAEKRREQRHEVLQQEAAEKLFNRLQTSVESTLPKQGTKQCKNWNREEIQQLDNGQDIYEAMMCAIQPDKLLNWLSESQLVMLADYKRIAEELKAQKLKEEFQKAISNEENAALKRNVTTIMKVRIVGCSHIDQQHKGSTILTIWRPSEDLQQTLEEGQHYKIYNLMPSPARFSFLSGLDVHLTVTRSTRYELTKRHPSIPQDIFQQRKISSAAELQTKSTQVDRLEVDVTGIVLRITKSVSANQRKHELVYVVDIEENIFALRFWGGLQIFFVNDLLLEEVVFAGLNLLLRYTSPQRGTSIPILDVCSEVSHFSVNPQQDHLRVSMDQLFKLKASGEFLVKSKEKLDSLLTAETSSLTTPRTPSTSDLSTDSPILHEPDEARERQRMIQQDKCTKLLAYGSSPSLSPLSVRLPSTVRKAFKPPSITKPKNN